MNLLNEQLRTNCFVTTIMNKINAKSIHEKLYDYNVPYRITQVL